MGKLQVECVYLLTQNAIFCFFFNRKIEENKITSIETSFQTLGSLKTL